MWREPSLARARRKRRTLWPRAAIGAALVVGASATGEPSNARRSVASACFGGRDASYDATIETAIAEVAPVWPLPTSFVKAVIQRESAFQPSAVSSAGAVGLMQVLPSNAWRLGFRPEALWSPAANILAGVRLLAVLLKHYQGDVISALVAYNARPRRRLAPLPNNGETPAYVRAVLRFWAVFQSCEAAATRLSLEPLDRGRHELSAGP
jgi:soluble lytic murein transglycosylase-like protein